MSKGEFKVEKISTSFNGAMTFIFELPFYKKAFLVLLVIISLVIEKIQTKIVQSCIALRETVKLV
jgi:uncharacterized membrane protein (UPF0182 family)